MAGKKKKTKIITSAVVLAVLIISGIITSIVNGGFGNLFNGNSVKDPEAEDNMYVNFIDVGQGDCTLITCKDTAILIDSGESSEGQTVINYLKRKKISDIDLVIATHPHHDHIGSMYKILTKFKIGDVIMPQLPESLVPTTESYQRFLNAVSQNAVDVIPAVAGESYEYGDLKVDILGPVKEYDSLNNMSVVAKITYKEVSVMFTGDAETNAENDMLSKNYSFNASLLKVGHHGSKSSNSANWLKAVAPKYAVVSCGINNDYSHPHKTTVKRLEKQNIEYFRTDLLGDIVFVSDGKVIQRVEQNIKTK